MSRLRRTGVSRVPPSGAGLERFFFLDDADRALVAKRRSDHSKLGFSLQLVTVRYLGTFLTDPLDVPTVVLDYVGGGYDLDVAAVMVMLAGPPPVHAVRGSG